MTTFPGTSTEASSVHRPSQPPSLAGRHRFLLPQSDRGFHKKIKVVAACALELARLSCVGEAVDEDELKAAFEFFDVQNKGVLTPADLKQRYVPGPAQAGRRRRRCFSLGREGV